MRRLYPQLRYRAAAVKRHIRSVGMRLLARAPGQGLVEYGLLLVLIMVVCVGILTIVGQTVSGVWYDKIIQAFT
jgi:Flp pilus assembly pilin Flp